MPRNTGGRRASKTNVSLSTPGGGSFLNHKPNYDLMRINNIKVHEKAEIQQAEIKSSNKLVVPMVAGGKFSTATEKGELMFDTSNNKLYISDLSGTGLLGDPVNKYNWIEITNTA